MQRGHEGAPSVLANGESQMPSARSRHATVGAIFWLSGAGRVSHGSYAARTLDSADRTAGEAPMGKGDGRPLR